MAEPLGTIMDDIKRVRSAKYPGLARLEPPSPPTNLKVKKPPPDVDSCATCQYYKGTWCKRFPKFERKPSHQYCGEYERKTI
jgi:hypothetical protein